MSAHPRRHETSTPVQGHADFHGAAAYFHIPFCRHRCGYCNFALIADRSDLESDYLLAVERELVELPGRPRLDSIYFGGGTPTQLSPIAFQRMFALVEKHFDRSPDCEITLEANPDDVPGPLFAEIARSPVNRISLGIQSFRQDRLQALDRQHTASRVLQAIEAIQKLPVRLSLDLIFGLPQDDPKVWLEELAAAIASGAGHLSIYELTIEKGTRFWNRQNRNQAVRGADDALADLYELTMDTLENSGLKQYEISSFARTGERSRHNQTYWKCLPWYGFGPSATSFSGTARETRIRSVRRYLRIALSGGCLIEESEKLSPRSLAAEQVIFGLRQSDGIDLQEWSVRNAATFGELFAPAAIREMRDAGLIEADASRLLLTRRGRMLADLVATRLLESLSPS